MASLDLNAPISVAYEGFEDILEEEETTGESDECHASNS